MKCPKCGFQSFNYLATCKKCGRDLSQIRDKFRLGDAVLPETIDSHPVGSAPPMPEDPFETSLPDEKDISSAANLASLPVEETDAALDEYLDEVNTLDPELAATLDPDMDSDWSAEGPTADSFGLGDELAEPILAEEDSLQNMAADATAEVAGFAEPEPEALPVHAPDALSDENPEDVATVQEDSDFSISDLEFEDDTDLDAWLLDGEEPSWRRTASEEDLPDPVADDFGPVPVGADFPPFDDLHQPELPFEDDMKKASIPARLLAFVLDTGLLALLLALFVMAGEYLRRGTGVFEWPQPQALADQIGPYFLVFFGLSFGYFTLFHYLGGQTPGKMAGKLLVVDISGEPLQLSQAFLRTVGGLICLLPVGLGFCSMLRSREGRGWNDRLAGSVVVAAEDGLRYQEND